MFEIKIYDATCKAQWDSFVAKARNSSFLFYRDYMEYHSDRFDDFSLMAYHKGKLMALLPANLEGEVLYSHKGLTYGGWVIDIQITSMKMCHLFDQLNVFLSERGIKKVVYKPLPWIYHSCPSEEDLYALTNVCHAKLTTRHISSSIDLRRRIKFSEARKSGIRKAYANHFKVEELSADELHSFWDVLENNLADKYHAHPVHSLKEISALMKHFPDNIRLFVAKKDNATLGGTLLYINKEVVHTQYISANQEGKKCGALDILFESILNMDWSPANYFDFGKSSDGNGEILNESLIFQKEGFGGRGVCYDWYEWEL